MGGGGFLGLGPAPKAPAAPDYTGAAQATAQGNLDAARANVAANRVNQYTPYGSLVYTQSGEDKYGNPMWSATQTLSPEQQKLYEYDVAASQGLGQLAQTGLNYVQNMMANPFSTQGLPALASQLTPAQMQQISGGPQLGQLSDAQAQLRAGQTPQLALVGQGPSGMSVSEAEQARGIGNYPRATRVNLRGEARGVGEAEQARGISATEQAQRIGQGPQLSALETAKALRQAGTTEELQKSFGQNVGMSGWDRASGLIMQRLEPQLQRQQERLDAQLAAQGIPIGSEAYTRAKQDLAMQQNDARIQAQLQAQGIQQNLFGQELAAGQFGNQATTQQQQNLLQNLGFSNQAQQQDYANRQAQLAFNNQMAQSGYQNQLAAQAANNAAIAQNFGQGLSAQQLANQAAQQNFANQVTGVNVGNQALLQNQQAQLAQQQANNAALAQNFGQGLSAQQLQNQAAQQNFANLLAGTGFNAQQAQQAYANQLAQQQANNQALLGQNQAQLANLGFTNQAQQQDFANRMSALGYNNQQIQQMYANQVAQQQANNAIAQQQFANQLTGANLANQARQQGFGELSYMRNEPLNTLNAVRSGAQVTGPQFVNTPQQAVTAGPDYLGASQMGYNAQLADFNAQQAAQANLNAGLFGLGGAGIMAFSDPRLKQNIKAVGVLPNGLTLYSFEYKDEIKQHPLAGEGVHVGVMADEVEQVFPYAVTTLNDGYKVVNYGLLP
jgi:hypothetical protein